MPTRLSIDVSSGVRGLYINETSFQQRKLKAKKMIANREAKV